MHLDYQTTKDIPIPKLMVDQVIGQEHAVNIIKKAALKRRNVLLIGSPGTGKSLIGQALAELLPKEKLVDILAIPNFTDENVPLIKQVPKGDGKELVNRAKIQAMSSFRNQNILLIIFIIIATALPYYFYSKKIFPFDSSIIYAASMLTSVVFIIGFILFVNLSKKSLKSGTQIFIPKLLIDNSEVKKAPYYDATGAHAGALLGDVLHDPLQSFFTTNKINKNNKIEIGKYVENMLKKHKKEIIKQKGYEATFLNKNEDSIFGFDKKIKKVNVLSVNKYNKKGNLMKITTESGKQLIVTPEHKIAVKGFFSKIKYVRADSLRFWHRVITINIAFNIKLERVKKIEKIPYDGPLYNLTTESGNLFVDGILVKNSGGLGTPAHERLIPGMIHRASGGVLFIDEISTLTPHSQQELLSAMQEKKYPITGQSERSSGAMTRSEPVPTDFILIAAGNLETVQHMHPALRSRIRGYGYEVYMNNTMDDTEENRNKLAVFVAQEVEKDGKIPHFTKEAVEVMIDEARKMASTSGKLTVKLRELGGLVRAAGDLANEDNSKFVEPKHIIEAKKIAKTLEQQIADKYIEAKKKYEVIVTTGTRVGRVNGLAVIGSDAAYSGIVLPIESEVTPGGKKTEFVATGKLGEIAKEAVKNVSALILKHFGEDIREKYDVYIQFVQSTEGVEGDSASIAVATSIISSLKNVPIKQDTAMTGSLSVRGEVLAVGGITAKVEAAIDAGIKRVIIPKSNEKDIVISKHKLSKIEIIPVLKIEEVVKQAMDWKGKEKILKTLLSR